MGYFIQLSNIDGFILGFWIFSNNKLNNSWILNVIQGYIDDSDEF